MVSCRAIENKGRVMRGRQREIMGLGDGVRARFSSVSALRCHNCACKHNDWCARSAAEAKNESRRVKRNEGGYSSFNFSMGMERDCTCNIFTLAKRIRVHLSVIRYYSCEVTHISFLNFIPG